MTSTLAQFYLHLKSAELKPIYLLASDVTLLQQEARDSLVKKVYAAGFKQREAYHVESGFDWMGLFSKLRNYTLFSEKTFVEIKHPSAKFDEKTTKALLSYLENPSADKIILLHTQKLTAAQQKTRWCKAIGTHGVATNIRAINQQELMQWIQSRARAMKLKLDASSVNLLAELTAGNLLASKQALQKCALLYRDQTIGAAEIHTVMTDSARFNVFDLSNLILEGKAQAALRCLHGLQETGAEITLILWALCREIRELIGFSHQQQQGQSLDQVLQKQWRSRQPLLKSALRRLSYHKLKQGLQLAETIDHKIKGLAIGNPWHSLDNLILLLCGKHELIQH